MPLPRKFSQGKSKERVLANRYIVGKRLGSGNFGTAWLVTDRKAKDEKEKYKVVKEMAVGDLQPDETVDAMHEAKLLRNLDHPGIVKFHDSFIEGAYFCIVTEYCEGGDLDHLIIEHKKKKKSIPEPQVVEWTIQLLLAVQYMHERNIFLRNNKIKIGDFGISRILMGTSDMASTFIGTPYYMSPEVLKHEGYNSKSDVWSIGCIMHELVALQHAFEGETLMGVMYRIVEGNIPEWPEKYSKELGQVCSVILTKEPAKRPSATEVLKIPFIANQMEMIKNTMMAQHHAKGHKDSINKEARQLANTMQHQPRLEDLKKDSEAKKWKNMTPRQRMRLRKQEEADLKAQKLREAGKKQLMENQEKYKENKKYMDPYETSQVPIWSGRPDRRKPEQHMDPAEYSSQRYGKEDYLSSGTDSDSDADNQRDAHTYDERQYRPKMNHSRQRYSTVAVDDRPITPMKNTMVYDVKNSSLDFKDGIPEKPEIADTYYSQFSEDFDEDEASTSSSDDHDIVYPTVKRAAPRRAGSGSGSDGDEAEGTLVSAVLDDLDADEEDLITCMQNALDKSETVTSQTLVADDSTAGAFGPVVKDIKIKNMRIDAIKKLGEKEFNRAYDFLKKARYGDSMAKGGRTMDEREIHSGLAKIVKDPNDCFIVDQLLFLEAQGDIAKSS